MILLKLKKNTYKELLSTIIQIMSYSDIIDMFKTKLDIRYHNDRLSIDQIDDTKCWWAELQNILKSTTDKDCEELKIIMGDRNWPKLDKWINIHVNGRSDTNKYWQYNENGTITIITL